MCGAYGLTGLSVAELEDRFEVWIEANQVPRLEQVRFSPHREIPTVSRNSPNRLVIRYWSLVPPWIKEIKDLRYPTFNARAETLREKPTYRAAWKNAQRCLIIATQFYEWKKEKAGKKVIKRDPYTIKVKDGVAFAMAGLYSVWNNVETTTIITTAANYEMSAIHERMPVILAPVDEANWLDKDTGLDEAYELLQPYPDGELSIMKGIPGQVSPESNSA